MSARRRSPAGKTIVGRAATRTMKQLTGAAVIPLESDDQKALVEYMQRLVVHCNEGAPHLPRETLWDYSYAVPNASKLAGGADQRAKMMNTMKAQGLKPGVSDLVIAVAAWEYHGAYLELKRGTGGRIGDEQAAWCRRMRVAGNFADIVAGFEQAKEFVDAYYSMLIRGFFVDYKFKFEPNGQ